MVIKNLNIFDTYMSGHHPDIYETNSSEITQLESFQRFCTVANDILNIANFLIFPLEKVVTIGDNEMITSCIFKCDLIVEDKNFLQGIQNYKVEIDWNTLQNFDSLKSFLQLQAPTISINEMSKKEKEAFCENIRLGLLTGYEIVFGINRSNNVQRIGFDPKDKNKFIFSDGILDISTGEFTPGEYNLIQNTSINISFPLEQIKNLTLQQSLTDILSLKNYISSNNTTSSIILGYMVAGIFRNEYKDIHNEFPFLGIQSYTGMGKTSLLNLLSRVCGYNWDTILGTCDSEYAFEVGMNSMGGWFYFFDEIQKASNKLLKYIQAAYNSGENRKGGANGNWQDIQIYRKDCSLICTGEYLPQEEEALLNRFIILDTKEPFLIKKNVKAEEEFRKYEELTGEKPDNEYLTTEQIKHLAINYYRPRFLNILKNKRNIKFNTYHNEATRIVEMVTKDFGDMAPDTRLINNLISAISGYMIICGDSVDENEIGFMVADYFIDLLDYRKDTYISGRVVNHVVDNIGEYCSWINKVKGTSSNYPMIYLKYGREKGLAIQIKNLTTYAKNKLESNLKVKHIEQQFRETIGVPKLSSKAVKVAKGLCNMSGVFIPLDIIKGVDPLKKIWDAVLDYLGGHVKELQKLKDDNQKYVMDDGTLQQLISEIEESYEKAEFFDTASYSKENNEIKPF